LTHQDVEDKIDELLSNPTSPAVVQVVYATSTTNDATTSDTFQNSSLSGAITPQFSDSIIEVSALVRVQIQRLAGTLVNRTAEYLIRDTTAAADLSGAARSGSNLPVASDQAAAQYGMVSITARHTPGSVAARTYTVQHRAVIATNLESAIQGGSFTGIMRIMEVRP
jgi:hypothetical protein